jgi:hypothetical protein
VMTINQMTTNMFSYITQFLDCFCGLGALQSRHCCSQFITIYRSKADPFQISRAFSFYPMKKTRMSVPIQLGRIADQKMHDRVLSVTNVFIRSTGFSSFPGFQVSQEHCLFVFFIIGIMSRHCRIYVWTLRATK